MIRKWYEVTCDYEECKDAEGREPLVVPNAKTAIFRYVKEYEGTEYPTNTELPIDVAEKEYEKYLKWKGYDL